MTRNIYTHMYILKFTLTDYLKYNKMMAINYHYDNFLMKLGKLNKFEHSVYWIQSNLLGWHPVIYEVYSQLLGWWCFPGTNWYFRIPSKPKYHNLSIIILNLFDTELWPFMILAKNVKYNYHWPSCVSILYWHQFDIFMMSCSWAVNEYVICAFPGALTLWVMLFHCMGTI
jgi:hypothetical protein